MTDNKERSAFLQRLADSLPENVCFGDSLTHEIAEAIYRAALAASQEKAEPVAYVDGDDSLRRILWEPDQAAFNLPVGTKLYAAPVAAQADMRECRHCGWMCAPNDAKSKRWYPLAEPVAAQASEPVAWFNGCDKTVPEALRYLAEHERPTGGEQRFNSLHLYQLADEIERTARRSPRTAPQPSAEAVRDAALDEAANTATGFLVGDPLAGIPLRNPMTHEIADAIRALKSAPPQPAEQPSATQVGALDAMVAENERLGLYDARSASPAILEAAEHALAAARTWIAEAPHGENCFVSSHYDGDPGDGCNCGKDAVLNAIDSVDFDARAQGEQA